MQKMRYLTKSIPQGVVFSLCLILSLFVSAWRTSNATPQTNDAGSKPPTHASRTNMPSSSGHSTGKASIADHNPASRASSGANDLKMPANFSAYASEPIGNGEFCVVGASTDDDGMNQKPIAYVTGTDEHPIWVTQLDLPAYTYQGRATHCSRSDGALLVLAQFDTQAAQTMSQTILRVVKLDATTGIVRKKHDLDMPGAYTTWVNGGSSHFEWNAHVLTVSGNYRTDSDSEHSMPFVVHLDSNLNQ